MFFSDEVYLTRNNVGDAIRIATLFHYVESPPLNFIQFPNFKHPISAPASLENKTKSRRWRYSCEQLHHVMCTFKFLGGKVTKASENRKCKKKKEINVRRK